MPTLMHALTDVQKPRIWFMLDLSLLFAAAVLVVIALSSSGHAWVLTTVLSHLPAVHAGTQVLASGTPPPLGCGGGVGTHC